MQHVSPDAIVDEGRGLVFPARIRLTRETLRLDSGQRPVLQPSMVGTVEVVTGRRRVIDYLLSPVARAVGAAGRKK